MVTGSGVGVATGGGAPSSRSDAVTMPPVTASDQNQRDADGDELGAVGAGRADVLGAGQHEIAHLVVFTSGQLALVGAHDASMAVISSRSLARARARRDFTVPTGMPRVWAASRSG